MHSFFSSGMVHQGERSVAECGSVANRMGGARGLLVYITRYGGRSAYLSVDGDGELLVLGDVIES